ncbi:MAG TPA: spore maturation protein, partial [Myxococcaceae bacterium]
GSAATAVAGAVFADPHLGPDSYVGRLVSVMSGSTETTFYVLAVYFGSVQVRVLRHTLIACLTADLAGYVAATSLCHLFFGAAPR